MNPMILSQLGIGLADGVSNLVAMFETPGRGPEKKEAVKKMALASLTATLALMGVPTQTITQLAQLETAVEGMIDTVVRFKNLLGAFTHTPAK